MVLTNQGIVQTEKHDWNVGLYFGTQEYSGDIGNEFFLFVQHGVYGISVAKYLTPFWDMPSMITLINMNYTDSIRSFETQFIYFNIMAKFGGCPDTEADGIEDSKDECPK